MSKWWFILLFLFGLGYGYIFFNYGKFHITNESAGFFLLRGGYRAWWIRYSEGMEYPYNNIFRDNLWCFPRFEHFDVRGIIGGGK